LEQLSPFLFLGFMLVIFYFMLVRPRQRQVAQQRSLIDSLQAGDEVVLGSGIYGTVQRIGDEDVDIEVSPGTTVKVLKAAVYRKVTPDTESVDEEESEESGT
jgi:preprotein translocase subunit YajC